MQASRVLSRASGPGRESGSPSLAMAEQSNFDIFNSALDDRPQYEALRNNYRVCGVYSPESRTAFSRKDVDRSLAARIRSFRYVKKKPLRHRGYGNPVFKHPGILVI